MLKVEISKWEDLQGIKSEDKWGNETKCIDVEFVSNTMIIRTAWVDGWCVRTILLDETGVVKGGLERVLEELKLCGFDVSFKKKMPKLTEKQIIELKYMRDVCGMQYMARDERALLVFGYSEKPTRHESYWGYDGDCGETWLAHEYIKDSDKEPWSIQELLDAQEVDNE